MFAQHNSIHHSELNSEAHTHGVTQKSHQVKLMKDVSRHERLITEALTRRVGSRKNHRPRIVEHLASSTTCEGMSVPW